MSDNAAGTPEAGKDDTQKGGTPEPVKDDSGQVTVSAQFKKEALENWKPAAEERNQLKKELEQAQQQLARLAYAGQQATDPDAEAYKQALVQAEYDPVARLAVISANKAVKAEAEQWLTDELDNLGDSLTTAKRKQVAALIRANNYQLSGDRALKLVTDPDSKTLAERLAEKEAELDRLKNARPNGVSPASVTPANGNADEGRIPESIKKSDYLAALQRAQAPDATEQDKKTARALKQAIGGNKTKLELD
jgi:hypothetical protein